MPSFPLLLYDYKIGWKKKHHPFNNEAYNSYTHSIHMYYVKYDLSSMYTHCIGPVELIHVSVGWNPNPSEPPTVSTLLSVVVRGSGSG